jgi:PAS domain S-box-containing protein
VGFSPDCYFAVLFALLSALAAIVLFERARRSGEAARLVEILRALPTAACAIDTRGRVVMWNGAMEALTGAPSCEMLGKGDCEYSLPFYGARRPMLMDLVLHPELMEAGEYADVKNENGILSCEVVLNMPCGGAIYGEASAAPILDSSGRLIGAVETVRDITGEHIAHERALFHEYGVRCSNTGVAIANNEKKLIYINPAFMKMWGYSDPKELLGRQVDDVFSNRIVIKEIIEYYKAGRNWSSEITAHRKDGSTFEVYVSANLVRDENGQVMGVVGMAVDITERRRQERMLKDFADELRLLARASEAVLGSLDPAALCKSVCAKAVAFSGCDAALIAMPDKENGGLSLRASCVGAVVRQCVMPESLPLPENSMAALAMKMGLPQAANDITSADGDALVARALACGMKCCAVFPLFCDGAAAGIIALGSRSPGYFNAGHMEIFQILANQASIALENVTLLRSLESRVRQRTAELNVQRQLADEARLSAEQASRSKSIFIANMSHELRTPLNISLGSASSLANGIFGAVTDKQLKYINYIIDSNKHLLNIINDILDLSHIDEGGMPLQIKSFNPERALDEIIAVMNAGAAKADMRLERENRLEAGELVYADERRFKQLLFNLISNAIKFSPRGGAVRLGVSVEDCAALSSLPGSPYSGACDGDNCGNYLLVSVRDNGIGIDSGDRDKLFKPFSQIDASLGRSYEGTGLGLLLAKRIVEMHNGRIWFESERGKGTVFYFTLPSPPQAVLKH